MNNYKVITLTTSDYKYETTFKLEEKVTKEQLDFLVRSAVSALSKVMGDKKISLVIIWEDYDFINYEDVKKNGLAHYIKDFIKD